jgi:hypothetical protein
MKHIIRTGLAVAALAIAFSAAPTFAQSTFHSVADRPGGSSSSVTTDASSGGGDSSAAMEAFKSLSPDDRNMLLQQAVASFKSMSPEERQALTEQAKAMGGDSGAFGAEWDKLLTPDQKKMVSDQLGSLVKDAPADTAKEPAKADTPMQDKVTALMIQIRSLTPAQQQALLNSLRQPGGATTATPATTTAPVTPAPVNADPCAEYKTANPAMYANCTSRMTPK